MCSEQGACELNCVHPVSRGPGASPQAGLLVPHAGAKIADRLERSVTPVKHRQNDTGLAAID